MHLTLAQTLDRCLDIAGHPSLAFGLSERRMQTQALAFLPRQHYRSVLELGCGAGALGRRLSGRADAYLGLDGDADAIKAAGAEPSPMAAMEFRQALLPSDIPDREFDLVVLSDILHELRPDQIRHLARRIGEVAPAADLLCLRRMAFEEPGEAFRPQALLAASLGWPLTASYLGTGFRIDVFEHELVEA
ncbi:class I SAM-dependent methyltransferase [Cereibacter sphaeroides]|uniref:methyltransferase n=1 Tax=Cereibacter sphaeroides TaxID=1063 RepID=UPI001F27F8B3|nr:class I SAM-dependent methyltransferase [Cereibacter sphaeroides]MCE6960491.1 class I SAM-dependent methyltransferase [Cereibacter sphaeroides]MCE6975499.1 class I SAM-dependent methyltransferase [Cereibacter sphaeroides]